MHFAAGFFAIYYVVCILGNKKPKESNKKKLSSLSGICGSHDASNIQMSGWQYLEIYIDSIYK
jgi:hypothetical protein